MNESEFPRGWDAERVQRLIEHYEGLSEDEEAADDDAAMGVDGDGRTVIAVPAELLPAIRRLLAEHQAGNPVGR